MKPFVAILVALLCSGPLSPAAVFIYKNKIKYTATGGGGTEKLAATGWTVISYAGGVSQVLAFPAQKKFAIVPMQSIEFGQVDAGAGKQYTYFIQLDQWTDGDGNVHIDTGGAKGLNVSMSVNGTTQSIPKTYAWSGRSRYPASSAGEPKFEESSGTLVFDKTETATSNSAGDDLNAAVERLAGELLASGYVDF